MSRPGYVDRRGSNADRLRRRTWLLETFDPELGAGRARCRLRISGMCYVVVDAKTLSVDRLELGGTYARHNIQPACKPCQDKQGGLETAKTHSEMLGSFRDARDAWEARFEAATNQSWQPGLIQRERLAERRGGRREVTDFVDEDPPPMLKDWIREWAASRRDPELDGLDQWSGAG